MLTITDPSQSLSYSYENGYFSFLNKKNVVTSVFSCREELAMVWQSRRNTLLFGGMTKYNLELVRKFWDMIASKLGSKYAIKIDTTNIKNIFVIYIPEAWLCNFLVKNIFSLLLRCSFIHYKGDFEKALNTYHLTKISGIQYAIKYFLDGNTKPTFKRFSFPYCEGGGFIEQFHDKDNTYIESKLVK